MAWKWFKFLRAAYASLPTAASMGVSTPIYDTTNKSLNISDGSAWRKVWDSGNAGPGTGPTTKIDADTVSGYGIGVDTPITMTGNIYDYTKGGNYYCPASVVDGPWQGFTNAFVSIIPISATARLYYGFWSGGFRFRLRSAGAWSTGWVEIWNSQSDGNGGQPPAPKPNGYDSSLATVGRWHVQDIASGGTTVTCAGSTGQAFWFVATYGGYIGGNLCGVANCGSAISGTTAGSNNRIWFWRIA